MPSSRPLPSTREGDSRERRVRGARTSRDSSKAHQGMNPSWRALQVIDPALVDAGAVVFAHGGLETKNSGAKATSRCRDDEADLKLGLMSISSPIARALIGSMPARGPRCRRPVAAPLGNRERALYLMGLDRWGGCCGLWPAALLCVALLGHRTLRAAAAGRRRPRAGRMLGRKPMRAWPSASPCCCWSASPHGARGRKGGVAI